MTLKNINYFILFILLLSCQSNTDNKSIQAVFVMGQVEKTMEGRPAQPVKCSEIISEKTVIKTSSNSLCYLKAGNLGLIKIRENTEVSLSSLTNGIEMSLRRGSIYNRVDALKQGVSYSIKTPLIAVGVRGTVFGVMTGENESKVVLTEGKVSVEGVNDYQLGGKVVLMEAGHSLLVKPSEGKKLNVQPAEITPQEKMELDELKVIQTQGIDLEQTLKEIQQSEDTLAKKSAEMNKNKESQPKNQKNQAMNLDQIKKVYQQLNEFELFNGQKILGGIVKSDEKSILVQTEKGQILLNRTQIRKANVVR